jgi:hypothetical protein
MENEIGNLTRLELLNVLSRALHHGTKSRLIASFGRAFAKKRSQFMRRGLSTVETPTRLLRSKTRRVYHCQ